MRVVGAEAHPQLREALARLQLERQVAHVLGVALAGAL